MINRCRCDHRTVCGFDPTTCTSCGGRIIKALKWARQFDRDNGITRDQQGVAHGRCQTRER